jgi:flagellar motor switch protein FliG
MRSNTVRKAILGLLLGGLTASSTVRASMQDDALRISSELQSQLQGELEKVVGKNKSSALVRLELELDPELQSAIKKSYLNPGYKAKPQSSQEGGGSPEFLWNKEKVESDSYILPGFQAKKKVDAQELEQEDRPDAGLVLAAGIRVKKISAKISLDRSVTEEAEKNAAALARAFLVLDPGRGDVLSIERIGMPTLWQRFLSDPGHYDGLIRNGILAFLVIGAFFVFLAAIDRFGKIIRRSLEIIAAALAAKKETSLADSGLARGEDQHQRGLPGEESLEELGQDEAAPALEQVIDIPIEKVGRLVKLLQREQAENVALVVPYLKEDVRYAFLSLLPQEQSVEVLSCLSEARYVEPEVFSRLKEEIEARVQNTVGGLDQVADLIRNARPSARKQMLDLLRQRKPEMFGEVRPQILLFEDLKLLEDLEWQMVLPAVKMNDLAMAFSSAEDASGSSAELMDRVKRNFPTKTRQIFEETLSFQTRVSQEQVYESQDRIVSVLRSLIEEHKVADPLKKLKADPGLLDTPSAS